MYSILDWELEIGMFNTLDELLDEAISRGFCPSNEIILIHENGFKETIGEMNDFIIL